MLFLKQKPSWPETRTRRANWVVPVLAVFVRARNQSSNRRGWMFPAFSDNTEQGGKSQ